MINNIRKVSSKSHNNPIWAPFELILRICWLFGKLWPCHIPYDQDMISTATRYILKMINIYQKLYHHRITMGTDYNQNIPSIATALTKPFRIYWHSHSDFRLRMCWVYLEYPHQHAQHNNTGIILVWLWDFFEGRLIIWKRRPGKYQENLRIIPIRLLWANLEDMLIIW